MAECLLTKRYHFRALHNLGGRGTHGHDYDLEVSLDGGIDPVSGLLFSRDQLDEIIRKSILTPLDKSRLAISGELLANRILEALTKIFHGRWLRVAIQETKKNRFVVTLDSSSHTKEPLQW